MRVRDDVLTAKLQLQAMRSSKSRLPAPASSNGGLTEWSESQHNSRIQTAIPAPPKTLKREIPQPGTWRLAFEVPRAY